MLMILIALVVAAVVTGMLFLYSNDSDSFWLGEVGVILSFITVVSSVVYIFWCWNWFAADHKMRIINREYSTSYTQEEIFYAGEVINIVRELDRKRTEVTVNVTRQPREK